MVDEVFAKRVHDEIGPTVDPIEVQDILNRDAADIFHFIGERLRGAGSGALTLFLFTALPSDKMDARAEKEFLLEGIRTVEFDCKLAVFLLGELRSRANAVDAKVKVIS